MDLYGQINCFRVSLDNETTRKTGNILAPTQHKLMARPYFLLKTTPTQFTQDREVELVQEGTLLPLTKREKTANSAITQNPLD